MTRQLLTGALVALGAISGSCASDRAAVRPSVSAEVAPTTPSNASVVPEATPPIDSTSPSEVETTVPLATAEPSAPVALSATSLHPTTIAEVPAALDVAVRAGTPGIYIVSQTGTITLRGLDGTLSTVLEISDVSSGGEQGLLGLTFTADGTRAYINSTNAEGDSEVAEYTMDADGSFDAATRRLLLSIAQPYDNHNGGGVAIGPDAMLYIAMGDGGSAGDPDRFALDTESLLGKMLRIDPTPSSNGAPYSIPADNPFLGNDEVRAEIWSIGLRNPWRFSFDRLNGDLWIGDVGQGSWEEVNLASTALGGGRGANFGWSAFEGFHRFNDDQPEGGALAPLFEYEHGDRGCSITGGVRYRGVAMPELHGWYVYGDYCSGMIWARQIDENGSDTGIEIEFAFQLPGLASIREDAEGELIAVSVTGGEVVSLTAR